MKIKTTALQKIYLFSLSFILFLILIESSLNIMSFFIVDEEYKNRSSVYYAACFGDSFTYGIGAQNKNFSYPSQLESISKKKVANLGFPGANSTEIYYKIKNFFKNSSAENIIFLGGVNNLWNTAQMDTSQKNKRYIFKTQKFIDLLYHKFKESFNVQNENKIIQLKNILKYHTHPKEIWLDRIFTREPDLNLNIYEDFFKKFIFGLKNSEQHPFYDHIYRYKNLEDKIKICEDILLNEKMISETYTAESYLNLYFNCINYFRFGKYKNAADLLFKSSIIQKYKDLYHVANNSVFYENEQFEIYAKNMFNILFINTENSFVFNYGRELIVSENNEKGYEIFLHHFINDNFNVRIFASIGRIWELRGYLKLSEAAFSLFLQNMNTSEEDCLLCSNYFYSVNKKQNALRALENWYSNSFSKKEFVHRLLELSIECNEYKKALYYLEECKRLFGDRSAEYFIAYAEHLFFSNEKEKCLELLKKIDSDLFFILFKKAELLKKSNKNSLSFELFSLLHKEFPNDERVTFELAQLNSLLYEYPVIFSSMKTDNDELSYEEKLFSLAYFYTERRDHKNAVELLKLCYYIDPDNNDYLYLLLNCLLKLEHFKNAEALFEKISDDILLKHPEINILQSFLLLKKNEHSAQINAEKIYAIHKDNNEIIIQLLELYLLSGNHHKFEDMSSYLAQKWDNDARFNMLNAEYWFLNNNIENCENHLNKVLAVIEDHHTALNMLGIIHASTQRSLDIFMRSFLICYDIHQYSSDLSVCNISDEKRKELIETAKKIILAKKFKNSSEFFLNRSLISVEEPLVVLENDIYNIMLLCKKNNSRLILQNYPKSRVNHIIKKCAQKYDIAFVDNETIFDFKADSSFFVADGHCSNKGYRLMAENIQNIIKYQEH